MKVEAREILEDVAATVLAALVVLGFTATHEGWGVWLIGDSRRWTAALLCILAVPIFALTVQHISMPVAAVLVVATAVFAVLAFWNATLTPLSLLAIMVVLPVALAIIRDLAMTERPRIIPH